MRFIRKKNIEKFLICRNQCYSECVHAWSGQRHWSFKKVCFNKKKTNSQSQICLSIFVSSYSSPIMNAMCAKVITYPWMWLLMKNPTQGAQTAIYLATEPTLKSVSGKYFK